MVTSTRLPPTCPARSASRELVATTLIFPPLISTALDPEGCSLVSESFPAPLAATPQAVSSRIPVSRAAKNPPILQPPVQSLVANWVSKSLLDEMPGIPCLLAWGIITWPL